MQASLKRRCLGLSSLKRTMARQRARIRQLREGDANTRYFHVAARGKRKQLFIPALDLGDRTAASQEELEQAVFDHFLYVFGRAPPVGLLSTSSRSATSRRTSQRLTCLSPRRKYGRRSKIGQVIERRAGRLYRSVLQELLEHHQGRHLGCFSSVPSGKRWGFCRAQQRPDRSPTQAARGGVARRFQAHSHDS